MQQLNIEQLREALMAAEKMEKLQKIAACLDGEKVCVNANIPDLQGIAAMGPGLSLKGMEVSTDVVIAHIEKSVAEYTATLSGMGIELVPVPTPPTPEPAPADEPAAQGV